MKAGFVTPIKGGVIKATAYDPEVHRVLLCASLADSETYVECDETSESINAIVESINKTGAKIRFDGYGFEVKPVSLPSPAEVAASSIGMEDYDVIRLSGANAYKSLSGILPSLALLHTDSKIVIEGKEEFKANTDKTIDIMGCFGVKVKREPSGDGAVYSVAGRQKYMSPGKIKIEGDWVKAAVWLCAAAIGGSGVICSNLNRYSSQSDKEIVNILERFGAIVAYKGDSVAIRRSNLRSIRIDAAEIPDLIPMLAVVAAVTAGQSVIFNAEQIRLNRSGFLSKISDTLNALGADVTENNDGLVIRGKMMLKGGTVSSQGDRLIVMMTALASGVCEDIVAVKDAQAVLKTYPRFFDDYEKLGGKVSFDTISGKQPPYTL